MREVFGILRSKTIRDTSFIFAGNLAGQGIGFLATLMLIRHLGPVQFGLFSTAIAVMGLASQFSDLGISTGFVRYASLYLKQDQHKADILFKMTLFLKLGVGFCVLLLGLLIAKPLAVYAFKSPELTHLLQLAFIGSLGATLWGYLQTILQIKCWFLKYAWINVFNNSLKLIGVLLLIMLNSITTINAMWILALVPFAGFFVDGLIVPKGFLKSKAQPEENRIVFRELFHLSKWVTLSTLCTMFLMRLDVFMLQSLTTPENVGVYNSANQLAMIFPLVTGSMAVALLPKVSAYRSKMELIQYIKKVLRLAPLILVIFIPFILTAHIFIPFIFGAKYINAVGVFRILIMAFSISIIINPISIVFYSINKAKLLTAMNIVQFIIAVPLNYYLINSFGAIGASCTSLIIRLFALVYVSYLLYNYFKKGNDDCNEKIAL